jgi:hypothetical protein
MTAPATSTPISVDYTNRDYYAIRDALIERVKDRTGDAWKGTDPNDFGLAIIEAFAYMGDMLGYYIDRVANESYLLTATQRDSLLNLASMYGYTPSNYVSASVPLTMTNNAGYRGSLGGAILETGTIDSVTKAGYAKIIVPNDHPFEVNDKVIVGEIPSSLDTTLGGEPITFYTSVYNGTYNVKYVGYDTYGSNVIWYRPASAIGSIVSGSGLFTVTMPAGSVSTSFVEFSPAVGQKVVISGSTSTGDGYNGIWSVDTVTDSTSTTPASFTVNTTAAAAEINFANDSGTDFTYSYDYAKDIVVGQKVGISGVRSASNNSGGVPTLTHFNFASATVTAAKSKNATINVVSGSGSAVTFNSSKAFEVNDIVSIYGISSTPNNNDASPGVEYNVANVVISAVTVVEAGITVVTPDTLGINQVKFTSASHLFEVGDYVTISGVVPTVYNMEEVRIISTTTNTFTVNASWTEAFESGPSSAAKATMYRFTAPGTSSESATSSGVAVCKQFTVAQGANTNPGAFVAGGTPLVSPLTGGTATVTSAEIYYADLPVVVLNGTAGYVLNEGSTTVPEGSQVVADIQAESGTQRVVFSTQSDLVLAYRSTDTVYAFHGEDISFRAENAAVGLSDIAGKLLGLSNGTANQEFPLDEDNVPVGSIQIFVKESGTWNEWTQVEHLQDYGPTDNVFQVSVSGTGVVNVNFGEGVSGRIPPQDSEIKTVYIAGGGTIGNVGVGTLTKWDYIPLDEEEIRANVTVTNYLPATGGSDPETDNSIRYNAPRALRTLNRAVTLEDFSNLSLTVGGVGKANAVADSRSSVTVYIAPTDDGREVPGFVGALDNPGEQTAGMNSLIDAVELYLSDKVQIGTTVTVLAPVYTAVSLGILYSVLPNYQSAVVETNIKKYLVESFSYENMGFAEVLTPEEVEFKLRQVPGVSNIRLDAMHRAGGSGRNSIVADADEILVFTATNFTLTELETNANLANIAFTRIVSGTPTGAAPTMIPATFNSNVYSYSLSFIAGTTGSGVTATLPAGSNASLVINDGASTSAVSEPLVLVNGEEISDIIVVVTAEDGMTVKPYRFKVNIAT